MSVSTGKATSSDRKLASALDELLMVEEEIAGTLAAAKAQAGALVAAARLEAAAITHDADVALGVELAALAAQASADRDTATKAIEAEASLTAQRFRTLDDATVARLAATIAAEVVGLSPDPAE